MAIDRTGLAAVTAVLVSALSNGTMYASTLQFGVVGSPIDMSANVSESILPGVNGNVFQESKPLFGTEPNPKQTSELLHISSVGVNPSSHSNVSGAFASSLAESDGNGGVGASQLIFGLPDPNGSDQNVVRQLIAQSLWTQTFVYNGTPTVDLSLQIRIPAMQVELWGIPPNRDNPSFTETAEVSANVDTVITHPDGTFSKGGSFELGLREFETQLPNPPFGLTNFADLDLIGNVPVALLQEDFDFPESRVRWRIDSIIVTDVDLGLLHTGDTLSYVYTLTAEGTTHGFERGYDAFLGDPFGVNVVSGNLGVTVTLADSQATPEASTCWLLLFGIAGLFAWRRQAQRPRTA
jgi:hypothetical protein